MTNFEFDGEKYKKASKHQKEWGNKIISELTLMGDERILDLGCGDGVLTKQLSNRVPQGHVLGIDASLGMIDTAKKLGNKNLKFQLMDIDEINFENEFDLIFSNATLHWVNDHGKLLENCRKALKPGGAIRFNFAGDGNCSNFFAVVKAAMRRAKFKGCFGGFEWPWYTPEIGEYRKLAEKSGFKEISVWEENEDRYFGDSEEMTRWIDQPSLVPFLRRITDAAYREEFRDAVVKEMIGRTKQADGTCFETFRRINVFAMKSEILAASMSGAGAKNKKPARNKPWFR